MKFAFFFLVIFFFFSYAWTIEDLNLIAPRTTTLTEKFAQKWCDNFYPNLKPILRRSFWRIFMNTDVQCYTYCKRYDPNVETLNKLDLRQYFSEGTPCGSGNVCVTAGQERETGREIRYCMPPNPGGTTSYIADHACIEVYKKFGQFPKHKLALLPNKQMPCLVTCYYVKKGYLKKYDHLGKLIAHENLITYLPEGTECNKFSYCVATPDGRLTNEGVPVRECVENTAERLKEHIRNPPKELVAELGDLIETRKTLTVVDKEAKEIRNKLRRLEIERNILALDIKEPTKGPWTQEDYDMVEEFKRSLKDVDSAIGTLRKDEAMKGQEQCELICDYVNLEYELNNTKNHGWAIKKFIENELGEVKEDVCRQYGILDNV